MFKDGDIAKRGTHTLGRVVHTWKGHVYLQALPPRKGLSFWEQDHITLAEDQTLTEVPPEDLRRCHYCLGTGVE